MIECKSAFVGGMKLGKLCILFTDGDWIESKDQSDSGIRLIQTGNIGNGEFLYKNDKAKYISVDTFKRLNCKEVFPNDILVSRLPEPVGRGCIIPDIGEKMITAVDCTICRINENLVDRKYFCYFLESNAYKTQLEQHVTGTTRKRISRKNLSSVEIDIPEQAKQKEVVYKLDRLKKIIQNYNRELDLLDELVRARFVEMFGTIYDKKFDMKTLPDIVSSDKNSIKRGPFGGALKKEDFLEDGYMVYEQRHAIHEDFKYAKYYVSPEKYESMIGFKVVPGDLIISCSGTLGRIAEVPMGAKEGIINQALLKISLNKDIMNNQFFIYQFRCKEIQDMLFGISRGSGIANMPSMNEVKAFKFICPPLELQNQFASFVKEIDKSRLLSNHSLFLIKSIIF